MKTLQMLRPNTSQPTCEVCDLNAWAKADAQTTRRFLTESDCWFGIFGYAKCIRLSCTICAIPISPKEN